MTQIDILEVKLEPGDTRESILAKKVRAELSYQKVSEMINHKWLAELGSPALKKLEEVKSRNLEEKISQPPAAGTPSTSEAYLSWMYASLGRQMPNVDQLLRELSAASRVEIQCAPLKEKKRAHEKAFYDYAGDYARLLDIGRWSAIADNLEGVVTALTWILKNCRVLRLKNRFCDGRRDIMARGGYRDLLLNIEVGGFVFELQLHLRALYNMKEEAHEILDVARAVIEPVLYKLSLLDSRESHDSLVQRIKALEWQVSSLTIEVAVVQKSEVESQAKIRLVQAENVELGTQLQRASQAGHVGPANPLRSGQCAPEMFAQPPHMSAAAMSAAASMDAANFASLNAPAAMNAAATFAVPRQLPLSPGPQSRCLEKKFRTKVCRHWKKGYCRQGEACSFAHCNTIEFKFTL